MNGRRLLVGGALLAVATLLLAAVVLQDASLALWTAVAVGVVAVAAGLLSGYAGARRLYLLGRYFLARPVDVETAESLKAGVRWLRVAGDVAAPSDVTSVLTGAKVAGRALRLERRTHPGDGQLPGIDRRELGTETELGLLALVDDRGRVRFEGEGTTMLAAPSTSERYDADHEPSYELIQALQRHDRTFDEVVGEGSLGEHRLHVFESTIQAGDPVELFGLLTVERDGVTTLAPAGGRGGTVAVGKGRRLPLRLLRGAIAGIGGAAVLVSLGWFVLAPVLG